jgi:tRNA modification GTPase
MSGSSGYLSQDTIAAVATALGGPIAIIRISGPETERVLRSIGEDRVFEPRRLTRSWLKGPTGKKLDDAMVVFFPGPDSYTGEDVAELHLHGGGFGVSAVMDVLVREGIRPALPGEFSFRAVRSGKLSLEQACAVADLISASNAEAVSLALDKLSGLLAGQLSKVAEGLRDLAALAEAGIDFSDQDLEEVRLPRLQEAINPYRRVIQKLADTYERGTRLQDGISVAFIGLPNAGKSSFFNALLGEDRSIVSAQPGTTRDLVRERLSLPGSASAPGVTLRLEDTAGLRASDDPVERLGIERSVRAIRKADLVLFLVDSANEFGPAQTEWDALSRAVPRLAEKTLGILTKTDLIPSSGPSLRPFALAEWVPTSAVTGDGISKAVQSITEYCARWTRRQSGEVLLTREDHYRAALLALSHLDRARESDAHELFAADLRQALHALAPLIGETPADEVLGRIFSSFCIGK